MSPPLKFRSCRGMKDLMVDEAIWFIQLSDLLFRTTHRYGYQVVQTPLLESRDLFIRAVGDQTDVVQKEMFSIQGEEDDPTLLTLRPEGTAGCVRAGIEHGLLRHQLQRWVYCGPMFRRERPQKGRYRQFHQFGIEFFGLASQASSLEILLLTARIFKELGLQKEVCLELNTLGTAAARARYQNLLRDYFQDKLEKFDPEVRQRARLNPLRMLDSKDRQIQPILKNAPQLWESLDEACREEFNNLCTKLSELGLTFTVSKRLVRGLDYYNGMVFEWTTQALGAQKTLCGGGRYDSLVGWMGGPETPAVGCAFGLERLLLLTQTTGDWCPKERLSRIAIVSEEDQVCHVALEVAEAVREALPSWEVTQFSKRSLSKQFQICEQTGYEWALVVESSTELSKKFQLSLKNLKDRHVRISASLELVLDYLKRECGL